MTRAARWPRTRREIRGHLVASGASAASARYYGDCQHHQSPYYRIVGGTTALFRVCPGQWPRLITGDATVGSPDGLPRAPLYRAGPRGPAGACKNCGGCRTRDQGAPRCDGAGGRSFEGKPPRKDPPIRGDAQGRVGQPGTPDCWRAAGATDRLPVPPSSRKVLGATGVRWPLGSGAARGGVSPGLPSQDGPVVIGCGSPRGPHGSEAVRRG